MAVTAAAQFSRSPLRARVKVNVSALFICNEYKWALARPSRESTLLFPRPSLKHTLCNIFVRSCRLGFLRNLTIFHPGRLYNITREHIIFYIKNVKASLFHFNMQ